MANKIRAIQTYGPRLMRGQTVRKRELVKLLSSRTGLNSSEISAVLEELRDAVLFYSLAGRGVRMDGLGTYLPYIKHDGSLVISYRPDPQIRKFLNVPGEFTGKIHNRESIGLTSDELVALWNADNPDDPIDAN